MGWHPSPPPRIPSPGPRQQLHTDKDRYHVLAHDLAGVGRRLVVCGMHVHIGIEDDELRIDMMNQARYFLPHLLVLATSSPFWEGEDTGLKSWRLAIFRELPRTGLPGRFGSFDEYRSTVDVLVKAKVIEDASKIWWDLRPSARFPTIEMRVTDVCTRARGRADGRRALPVSLPHAVSPAPQQSELAHAIPSSCWRRTAGAPSATASAARCSISARASWSRSRR